MVGYNSSDAKEVYRLRVPDEHNSSLSFFTHPFNLINRTILLTRKAKHLLKIVKEK